MPCPVRGAPPPATAGRWLRAGALVLALLGLLPAGAAGQDGAGVLERRVKGALLYRFVSYVEWPPSAHPRPGAPIVIAIMGSDALAADLESFVVGRTLYNRPVLVRRLRAAEGARDAHVVFIDRHEAAQLPAVARAASRALIVTEWPGALEQGGIINFLIVEQQVRFEISLEAARKRDLAISSRLLSVAQNARELKP